LCSTAQDPDTSGGFVSPAVRLGLCRVIFGMLIALPITLVYYILLGL